MSPLDSFVLRGFIIAFVKLSSFGWQFRIREATTEDVSISPTLPSPPPHIPSLQISLTLLTLLVSLGKFISSDCFHDHVHGNESLTHGLYS